MQSEHRVYEKAFKIEAVRLVQTSGKSISQVAKDLGIPDSNLCRWCQQYGAGGEQAFRTRSRALCLYRGAAEGVSSELNVPGAGRVGARLLCLEEAYHMCPETRGWRIVQEDYALSGATTT
jgi:hypothetical protein